jgi:hypothetical protein
MELEEEQDAVLVIMEFLNDPRRNSTSKQNEKAEVEITISGNEIQYLQVGSSVRGHVTNHDQTYKIYQVIIN